MFEHLLQQLYMEGLGRAPDQEGLDYWRGEIGKFQGDNTQTLDPKLMQAFQNGAISGQPGDYEAFAGFREWEPHNQTAQAQTAALNSAPGVYNYGTPQYYNDDEMKSIMTSLKDRVGGLGGLGGVKK